MPVSRDDLFKTPNSKDFIVPDNAQQVLSTTVSPSEVLDALPADKIIRPTTCKLCNLPNKWEVDNAILKGTATKHDICTLYGVTREEIDNHIRNHTQGALSKRHLDRKDWLENYAQKLSSVVDMLISTCDYDPKSVRALVAALAELRQEIRTLAEIEGQLAQKPSITIQQFNSLRMIVLGDLCDECKKKVISKIRELEAIETPKLPKLPK